MTSTLIPPLEIGIEQYRTAVLALSQRIWQRQAQEAERLFDSTEEQMDHLAHVLQRQKWPRDNAQIGWLRTPAQALENPDIIRMNYDGTSPPASAHDQHVYIDELQAKVDECLKSIELEDGNEGLRVPEEYKKLLSRVGSLTESIFYHGSSGMPCFEGIEGGELEFMAHDTSTDISCESAGWKVLVGFQIAGSIGGEEDDIEVFFMRCRREDSDDPSVGMANMVFRRRPRSWSDV